MEVEVSSTSGGIADEGTGRVSALAVYLLEQVDVGSLTFDGAMGEVSGRILLSQ